MKNRYQDLIEQSFDFPVEGFEVEEGLLHFNGIDLRSLIKEYGTPLRITYLPRITKQIAKARQWFDDAKKELDYEGDYFYCYCTKSSHFAFVLQKVLESKTQLETSSATDIHLVERLYERQLIDKKIFIVCNGFKTQRYVQKISQLINAGFENTIPVLDNLEEIKAYESLVEGTCHLGIRIAAEEEPSFEFYTSRLGIRYIDIETLYKEKIEPNPKFKLKMLHFFINTGIRDSAYYWSELQKSLKVYCRLKKICPDLDSLNIGGGFPIANSLGFEYDYAYMLQEILTQIKHNCKDEGVPVPNIFTEFGSFTVGESGAMIYSVLGEKLQNDKERWYMIDNSLMSTLPDIFAIGQRFILLPVNKWENEYQRVNIGGLSCDSYDYYNSEVHINEVHLPKVNGGEPLYIGLFHTGAYQEALSGYGGIKHCLIPSPKHLVIDYDENGQLKPELFADEQNEQRMLEILGY